MSIRQICFTSREHAESRPGAPGIAVISVTDPGTPPAALSPCFGPILRLAFYDAVPADEYLPAPPGLFDHRLAAEVCAFIDRLQQDSLHYALLVHCEYGISRSAALALFAEAYTGAPLAAREYAGEANQWVIDCLQRRHPEVAVELPAPTLAIERRHSARA